MGRFSAGQVVFLEFPFSDLSRSKRRPALLIADAGQNDWIVCQITSNPYADRIALSPTPDSFEFGDLKRVSYVRPGKLFTASEDIVVRFAGQLRPEALARVRQAVIAILQG